MPYNRLTDPQECHPSLTNRLDEPFSLADVFPDEIFCFTVGFLLFEHLLVFGVDPEPDPVSVVDVDFPSAVFPFVDVKVGNNRRCDPVVKITPRMGVQFGDFSESIFNFLFRTAGFPGDERNLFGDVGGEVAFEDQTHNLVVRSLIGDLQKKPLGDGTRADSRRIHRLNRL